MAVSQIDMDPILNKCLAMTPEGGALAMQVFKARMQKRIENNEHIHLYGAGVEECIYPSDQCWQGVRPLPATRDRV